MVWRRILCTIKKICTSREKAQI